jgi:hypothetical protein
VLSKLFSSHCLQKRSITRILVNVLEMRTIIAFAALTTLLAVAHAGNVPRTTPGMRQGSPSAPVMIEMFVDLQVRTPHLFISALDRSPSTFVSFFVLVPRL